MKIISFYKEKLEKEGFFNYKNFFIIISLILKKKHSNTNFSDLRKYQTSRNFFFFLEKIKPKKILPKSQILIQYRN